MPRRSHRLGSWKPAAPFGIEVKDNVWNTGSVWAVCPLSQDRLLIGAEQGGLWVSEPDATGAYQSRCVSDTWDHWGFNSCVQDPANPERIFVGTAPGVSGTAGLYLGSFATQPETWVPIPLPRSILSPDTAGQQSVAGANKPSAVAAMIILPVQRLLVVATGSGVGWMQIDSQPFVWQSAPHKVTDLTNLPGDDFLFVDVVTAGLGQSLATWSLNKGTISGGVDFVREPIPQSAIRWKRRGHAIPPRVFAPVKVASCKGKPQHSYCMGSIQRAEIPNLFVIRSRDAGKTWQECAYATGSPSQTLGDVLDFANFDALQGPKSPKSLAVHPINPEILAAGYRDAALSTDGGNVWMSLANLEGAHRDIHDLLFHLEAPTKTPAGSPPKPRRYSLYIPSDGGILRLSGSDNNTSIAKTPLRADSSRNRSLPIVMLYAPDQARVGGLGDLAVAAGVFATGSQDNSNLWLDPQNPQWRLIAGGGDGGPTAISLRGVFPLILHAIAGAPIRVSRRASPSSWGSPTVVPVRLSANAMDAKGLVPAVWRTVPPPADVAAGEGHSPVIALASPARSRAIYAAIIKSVLDPAGALITQEVEWIEFGQIPAGETVSSLEAHNRTSVLAGTKSGRVFLIKEGAIPTEASFNHKPLQPISGIASNGTDIACFAAVTAPAREEFEPYCLLYTGRFKDGSAPKTTRRRFDFVLADSSAFPRNDKGSVFHSISANRSKGNSSLSFALTVNENEVWVCFSGESRWRKAVAGLPHAVRCADAVFSESGKGGELLLSSYGRAVWRLLF